jgi:predicted transcriptional regulator
MRKTLVVTLDDDVVDALKYLDSVDRTSLSMLANEGLRDAVRSAKRQSAQSTSGDEMAEMDEPPGPEAMAWARSIWAEFDSTASPGNGS